MPSSTNIPNLLPIDLKEKYEKFAYKGEATLLWEFLESFIKTGSREYFEEWTDHGWSHIEEVLENAKLLIAVDASATLTPEDVFCLCTSILLHDLAMLFGPAVVRRLLDESAPSAWGLNSAWRTFCTEMQHWQPEDVAAAYGADKSIPKLSDIDRFGNLERFVVGEFLRRHHGDICKSVVDSGFELLSLDHKFLAIYSAAPEKFKLLTRLSAAIARSHTMELRKAITFVKEDFGIPLSQVAQASRLVDTHFVYLMAVIRIADYLDFRRSSSQYFLAHAAQMKSPLSKLENQTMDAFIGRLHSPNMEEIILEYSTAGPDVYFRFEKYLRGIQNELDVSWAVMSEYYSFSNATIRLAARGLTTRRVVGRNLSSLSQTHYQQVLRISVSDASIIYLLAGPLYNNDPRFSIREILSNSHDACSDYVSLNPGFGALPTLKFTFDEVEGIFVFEDDGVGMSFDDIQTYFLHVGGRIRNSIEWKVKHVEKAGSVELSYAFASRFGVGVLSLFMIGQEIRIKSKREDSEGVALTIKPQLRDLVAEHIEARRGTRLELLGKPEMLDKLSKVLSGVPDSAFLLFLLFCRSVLMYVPFSFDIHFSLIRSKGTGSCNIPSISSVLGSNGIRWFAYRAAQGAQRTMEFLIVQQAGSDSKSGSPIVYNGIPLEQDVDGKRRSDLLLIQDPSNSLRFNLQKTEFEDFPWSIIAHAHISQFEGILDLISARGRIEEFLGPTFLPSWLRYARLEPLRIDLLMDNGEIGRYPMVYFYNGKIMALSATGISWCKESVMLAVGVRSGKIRELAAAIPHDFPVVLFLADSNYQSDNESTVDVLDIIRWKSTGKDSKPRRNRTYHDRRRILDHFPQRRSENASLDHFIDVVEQHELTGHCLGIAVINAHSLAQNLAALRADVLECTWERVVLSSWFEVE